MCEQYAGFFKTFSNAGHPVGESSVFDAEHGRGVAVVRTVGHLIKTRCVIFYCNCAPWKNESPSKIGRESPLDQENLNLIMMRVIPNEEYRGRWLGRTRRSSFRQTARARCEGNRAPYLLPDPIATHTTQK